MYYSVYIIWWERCSLVHSEPDVLLVLVLLANKNIMLPNLVNEVREFLVIVVP